MTMFSAEYDTKFVATVDDKGALQIAEVPGERDGVTTIPADGVGAVTIRPKAARAIIADLEDAAGEAQGYGDDEINAVQHWILARAYNAARPADLRGA